MGTRKLKTETTKEKTKFNMMPRDVVVGASVLGIILILLATGIFILVAKHVESPDLLLISGGGRCGEVISSTSCSVVPI